MTDRINHRTKRNSSDVVVSLNGEELLTLRSHAVGGYVTPRAASWGSNVAQFRTVKQALATIRTRVRNFRKWGIDPTRIYADLTIDELEKISNNR